MDCLGFIARVISPIPNKGRGTVRYSGLYANARPEKIRQANLAASPLPIA
ncbi:MAG: hypothetical protein ACUVR0_06775 [Candidatus Aminicenantales bacterium]